MTLLIKGFVLKVVDVVVLGVDEIVDVIDSVCFSPGALDTFEKVLVLVVVVVAVGAFN